MLCLVFGVAAIFFCTLAILICFSAGKEMQRRDADWRRLLDAEKSIVYSKDRALSEWNTLFAAQQKKIKELQNQVTRRNVELKEFQNRVVVEKKQESCVQKNDVAQQVLECVICMERAPLLACIPCGHKSTCFSCVKCMENQCCPICRAVGQFYNIYDSAAESESIEKELKPDEIVKRKGLIRRFLDKLKK